MSDSLKEDLEKTLGEAEWSLLAKHAERDAIILVGPGISLLEVGIKTALDDSTTIQGWIAARKLQKPTPEQLAVWNAEPSRVFLSLVVQPYVFIQEIVH
jgi:hypothetical protein